MHDGNKLKGRTCLSQTSTQNTWLASLFGYSPTMYQLLRSAMWENAFKLIKRWDGGENAVQCLIYSPDNFMDGPRTQTRLHLDRFKIPCHFGGPCSRPGQSTYDLWTKWQWGRFYSEFFDFPCQYDSTVAVHTKACHLGMNIRTTGGLSLTSTHPFDMNKKTTGQGYFGAQWVNYNIH
jgi:hypothetical protein